MKKIKLKTTKRKTEVPKKKISQAVEKAMRDNEDKRQWSLIDWDSLEVLVEVLEIGSKKYSPNNWQKGMPKTELLDSLQRHVVELLKGNELDEETGKSHAGHIMANSMFYLYFDKNQKFK